MRNVSSAVIQFLASSKTRIGIVALLVLATGVFTTVYLVGQQQDIRQRASENIYQLASSCNQASQRGANCPCTQNSQCTNYVCTNGKCEGIVYTPPIITVTPVPSIIITRISSRGLTPTITPSTTPFTVFGEIFIDTNKDGKKEAEENLFTEKNVSIKYTANNNCSHSTTSSNGKYSISNPCPSSTAPKSVEIISPSGYYVTTQNPILIPKKESIFATFGIAQGSPLPTPTKRPRISPSPTVSCSGTTNRPLECPCSNNTQCSSGFCAQSTSGSGVCGSITPSLIVTPSSFPITLTPSGGIETGNTKFRFSFNLPGIGNKSASGSSQLTSTPKRLVRNGDMIIYNSNLIPVDTLSFTARFDPSTSGYTAIVDLGNVPTGNYLVKMRLDNSLFKFLPGVQAITKGTDNRMTNPPINLSSGDIIRTTASDNNIDISDYNALLSCLSTITGNPLRVSTIASAQGGPAREKGCSIQTAVNSDLNDDDFIDLKDLNILLRAFAVRNGD